MAKLRVQIYEQPYGMHEVPQDELEAMAEECGIAGDISAQIRLLQDMNKIHSQEPDGVVLTWHLDYSKDTGGDFGCGLYEDDMMFGVSMGG